MENKQYQNLLIIVSIIVCLSLFLFLLFTRISSFGTYETFSDYTPIYAVGKFPRITLLQTNQPVAELIAQRKKLHTNHISGVILSNIPSNWYDKAASLNELLKECRTLNHIYTENYLVTRLIPPVLEIMPNWDNLEDWATINTRIQDIAIFAKKAGFKGLVIDTTVADSTFWCPEENPRYKDISDEFASKVIYQRAREMIQKISSVSNTMPLIVSPAGIIATQPKYAIYPYYQYWIHFANGLLSTRHPGGITFIASHYNSILTTQNMQNAINSDLATINAALDEKQYWQDKGALSILVGTGTTENVNTQLYLAQKYSQRYVIISDGIDPVLVAPLYDPRLKSYYEYVCTGEKPLWISYKWRILLHTIKDRWNEII